MKNDDKKYMPKAKKGMLSFAVTSTSQGQQVIYSINENIGEIRSFAEGSDDRNFYKHLAFKEGKDQVVICISHANEGCYLRILRYIHGRSGDNQEAWIWHLNQLDKSQSRAWQVRDRFLLRLKNAKVQSKNHINKVSTVF